MNKSLPMPGARLKNKKHTLSRIKLAKEWLCRLNNYVNRTDLCNFIPTSMNKRNKEVLSPTLK